MTAERPLQVARFLFLSTTQRICSTFSVHILYLSDITASDDPPRPTFDSVLSRDMAGYMPARADFMEVRRYMCPAVYHLCANIACQHK